MTGYWARFDLWHAMMTIVPAVAAVIGAVIITRWPSRLGAVVLGYAAICVADALMPFWLARGAESGAALRPVLVETRLAFVLGLILLLAAGGRAPRSEAPVTEPR